MHLGKFVESQTGRYLMSIILGFGLATLFQMSCKGTSCQIIKSPPMEDINDKTFQFNDKYYKITKTPVTCNRSKRIVSI